MAKKIEEMAVGQAVDGFYLVKSVAVKMTAAQKPYLSGDVADKSGSIAFVMWDYAGEYTGEDLNGSVVKLTGVVSNYKDKKQIVLKNIQLTTDESEYDLAEIVPVAPINVNAAMEYVESVVASFKDPDYRLMCEELLRRHRGSFMSIPAARSVHHAFVSGLLMHTSNMLRLAEAVLDFTPHGGHINRDLLLAGVILHDIAKEKEFNFSDVGLATDYSTEGALLGHLVLGAIEIQRVAEELNIPQEKATLLQHMMVSHHGEPEWGAAVVPMTIEAEVLHRLDMLDSHIEIYAEVLENTPEGKFSDRIFALEHKIFNHS